MPHDPPHDPPTEDVLDAPLVGVKLNVQWWSHVIGLASVAARQSYWASDQERGEESMEQLLDLLAKGNLPVFDPLSARVRRTTNQLIPHNTLANVVFDTVVWDVGDLFDIAQPTRLALPELGVWAIGGELSWPAGGTGLRRSFIENQATQTIVSSVRDSATIVSHVPLSTIHEVTTATYVEFWVKQQSGGPLNIKPGGDFSIDLWAHYLGPI